MECGSHTIGRRSKERKSRYFRLLGAQDWDSVCQCFTDDPFDVRGPALVDGAGAFVAEAQQTNRDPERDHHGHMPELTIAARPIRAAYGCPPTTSSGHPIPKLASVQG